ncbi:MAG: nuclear transport factor 2 family protein [Sphingomonas sp.]
MPGSAGCMSTGSSSSSTRGARERTTASCSITSRCRTWFPTVADDGLTAKGRFRGILLGGSHDIRKYRPAGVPQQFMESGIYENDYVREDGVWKIKRLDYVLQWQAEYETGWAHTDSHLQPAQVLYPENPLGPDYFTGETRQTWPYRQDLPVHYAHPVIARLAASGGRPS